MSKTPHPKIIFETRDKIGERLTANVYNDDSDLYLSINDEVIVLTEKQTKKLILVLIKEFGE